MGWPPDAVSHRGRVNGEAPSGAGNNVRARLRRSGDPSGMTAGTEPLLTVPVLVDPLGDDVEVEAQQVAPLDERDLTFGDQPPHVTNVHTQALGNRGDVDQVGHGGLIVALAVPA